MRRALKLLIVLLVLSGLFFAAYLWLWPRREQWQPALTNYVDALFHPSAKRTRAVSGTIEVDEAHVASRYGGRVEKLFAREGDVLTSGQLVAQLEATELLARRALQSAALAEAVAGPRAQEIEAAKNDWESLAAQLRFELVELQRQRTLYEQHTISKSDFDRQVSRTSSLEQSTAAAKQRYDLLVAGTRPERIEQARAQLAETETQLEETRILAPGHTVLETLSVKVGDVLPANREVATLLYPDYLWIRVYVPETWLGYIHLGQEVEVRVDSFPNERFPGIVEQINRQAEFTPRNVQTVQDRVRQVYGVKLRLPNRRDLLRAGMAADVFFPGVPPVPR